MKGKREFMEALTARTDIGIEFVKRFQINRIIIAIMCPVVLSALLVRIFYSIFLRDVSSAATVAGMCILLRSTIPRRRHPTYDVTTITNF